MKSTLRVLIAVLMFGACSAISGNAVDSSDAEEIKKIGRAFDQAIIAKNLTAIDTTLTDDCVGIWPDGSTSTKAEMLANIKSGNYKLFTVSYKEENVRVYGNTAVSTVLSTVEEEDQGRRQRTTGWATGVWIKKEGKWKVVSVHISNKPKAE